MRLHNTEMVSDGDTRMSPAAEPPAALPDEAAGGHCESDGDTTTSSTFAFLVNSSKEDTNGSESSYIDSKTARGSPKAPVAARRRPPAPPVPVPRPGAQMTLHQFLRISPPTMVELEGSPELRQNASSDGIGTQAEPINLE